MSKSLTTGKSAIEKTDSKALTIGITLWSSVLSVAMKALEISLIRWIELNSEVSDENN